MVWFSRKLDDIGIGIGIGIGLAGAIVGSPGAGKDGAAREGVGRG
jgi:hypothetical protein